MSERYGITSRDYLKRAKIRLDRDEVEHLFYAALEIRSGIEARMQEYLEVQKHISKRKRQGWQVAKLARNIENVFRLGDKEAIIIIREPKTGEVLIEAKYTPVKLELRKMAEKFGNYLHNAKKHYGPDNEFWIKFRSELEKSATELEYANSGRLLGPLLIHRKKNHVEMKLELPTQEEKEVLTRYESDDKLIFEVRYE